MKLFARGASGKAGKFSKEEECLLSEGLHFAVYGFYVAISITNLRY